MDFCILCLTIAAYITALFSTCVLLLWGYRLVLHPLKDYPGPLPAKLTDAYSGFYALLMSLHVRTRQDHLEYGPVIRLGPNKLVFSSLEAIRDIYLNERLAKSSSYKYTAATPGVYGVFNIIDPAIHRFKRKLVGQAISDLSMRKFEPVMRQQINTFLQLLASPELHEIPINMTVLVKRLTFDIVGLLAFGNNLKTQTHPAYRSLIDAQTAGNHRSNIFLQYPFLYKTKIFSLLELFASDQVLAYYNAIEKMIALRVAEPKHARHDLYSLIVDEMNPDGEYLKNSEIWAEAAFFLPAGADTISGLICASLFYLSRSPDCYAKLASEIRSCFASGDDIQIGHKLSGCKYLRATLDETLRMSPPAAETLWREISPEDKNKNTPVVIDGHVIPLGVQVGVNTYSIHHNEEYFPNSFAFKPERWLDDAKLSADERKSMQKAFIPFSIGARGCAGKAMAYAQCSLVLATILWYFDFDATPGNIGRLGGGNSGLGDGRTRENEYQLYDVASATHDGPILVFRQRMEVVGAMMSEAL